jgi:hypothetical protein
MDPSTVQQNVQKGVQNYVSSHPGVRSIPVPQLTGAVIRNVKGTVLTDEERDDLAELQKDLARFGSEYEEWKEEIQAKIAAVLEKWDQWPADKQYLRNRIEHLLPDTDAWFARMEDLSSRAGSSRSSLRRLQRNLTAYRESGDGRKLVEKTVTDVGSVDDEYMASYMDKLLVQVERNELTQIKDSDEKFFQAYLDADKPGITVFRGDGRGVKADSLDNFTFTDIKAEGNSDISFYGVVQHTHSSADKNGMVSTTTDKAQAIAWAVDGKRYGLLYELRPKNYIDVGYLLRKRNFRNRFAGQLEILIPGDLTAAEIVAVSLYRESDRSNPVKRIEQ